MSAQRDRFIQQDFSEGMNRDVTPTLISEQGVFDLVDALLDEDGNPYRRGGTRYKANAGLGSSGLTWAWDGYLLPGHRTLYSSAADFAALAEDDATPVNVGGAGLVLPKQSAVLEDLLFIGGGSIYGGSRKGASYSTGTVAVATGSGAVTGTGTKFSANVDVGMLFQIGDERVYVVASVDSDTKLTLHDAYQGATGAGKSYALIPLYSVSAADPYEANDFVTVCANRLVTGSGHTIKFTEVKNPHTFTNSGGTTNEHTLPDGVWLVGLVTVGDTVLAFTTGGVWVVDGLALDITDVNGNPQHRIQQLSSEVVLAGAAGLAGSGQRIVVPASDGVYLMDGISAPTKISKPIDRLYRQRIADGYALGGAVVFRGHYFLPIIDGTARVRDLFVCRLDRPSRDRSQVTYPWGRFTGDGGEVASFAVRNTADPRQPVLLGAQAREPSRLVDCTPYFAPSEANMYDADGSNPDFDLITRDIATGGMTENVVRGIKNRYELVEGIGEEAVMQVYWSDGSLAGGEAEWDEIVWDAFDWVSSGAVFRAVSVDGPASDGRKPVTFPVNKRLRYGRFRIKTSGPVAFFALRALEMDVRPSKAVRR